MATFQKFNAFIAEIHNGGHNLGADTLKVALTNTAPVAGNAVLADITQIAAANGYTAGGQIAALVSSTQIAGTYKLVLGDVGFTATGGTMGPFRYAVLYNDTSSGDKLIGWWDYGFTANVAAGESFTVDFSATNGVLTNA